MISPLEFFSHLRWIDDRPLLDVIEPYRQRIFTETLYTFGEDGTPHYNRAVSMKSTKKRLLILELVAAGQMPLDEARRRLAEILQRSRRGRILLRIERAERIVGGAPR